MVWHRNALSYDITAYDNIGIFPANNCNPWWSGYTTYPGSPIALTAWDGHLYISDAGGTPNPTYPHKGKTYTLAEFQGLGFDTHVTKVAGGRAAAFDDVDNFILKSEFTTVGRDGGKPGPSDPATLLDLTRYGPEALIVLEASGTDPATALSFSGPGSCQVGAVSGNYYVIPNGLFTGTVTPSDGGAGGVFTPSSLSWSAENAYKTFTYTPAVTGTLSISLTNDGGLPNPSPLALIVTSPVVVSSRRFPSRFLVVVGPQGVSPSSTTVSVPVFAVDPSLTTMSES
jgi:hypothetical protein